MIEPILEWRYDRLVVSSGVHVGWKVRQGCGLELDGMYPDFVQMK
jgi:hypothetical protein